jgi:hypothetical protein
VVLVLSGSSDKQIIKLPSGIEHSDETVQQLASLVGHDNIKIQ